MWSTMCPAELVGDREAGQQAMCLRGLLRPALRGGGGALALTFTLCAKHKHPLAGDDLEFVVLAAAGHLNGGQRDHTLGEGVLVTAKVHQTPPVELHKAPLEDVVSGEGRDQDQ